MLKNFWRQFLLLFPVIRGIFQPGLAKIVHNIVVGHLRSNPEFCSNRYPPLVRAMRWAVGNPLLALAIIACPYIGILLSTYFGWVDGIDPAINNSSSVRDFWTINLGVFAVQTALIGVVFPLVIAFVGLLNQGRSSFASRLTIYIESSGAVFVGASSLLLSVTIAVQLPFGERFVNVSFAVTLLNIVWFAMNAFALGYFVLRTIAFLHPAQRAPIIRNYVANVVWPRELEAAVTSNRWANAVDYGYLPGGDESDPFATGSRTRIWCSALWQGGEVNVSRRFTRKVRLIDVRFGVLAAVVESWLAQARELDDEQNHDFVIPLQPSQTHEGDRVLARATIPLGSVARRAIMASLRFKKAPAENGAISETSKILGEMIADLVVFIDARQADEFADQLLEVVVFHAFLYRLAQKFDEGTSYAQLQSGQSIFSSAINEDWARNYGDMIRRIIKRLPDEPEFMRPMAYAPSSLYSRVSNEVTPEALQPILSLAESLAYRLTEWALGEYRAETASGVDDIRAFTLTRQGEIYAGAWREQVAGWERLLQTIASAPNPRNPAERSWKDLTSISGNVYAHLSATTKMAARAVWHGDTLATSWTSDLMLHWLAQAEREWKTRTGFPRVQSEALTLETLQCDWGAVEELPLMPSGEAISAPKIFSSIMNNTWRDHVFILASVCIHWAIHRSSIDTAPQAARMLLHAEPYDRGETGVREIRGFSGTDFLISVLRIAGSGEHFSEDSYAGRIDHLLEGIGQFGDTPKVLMRFYSSGGGLSFSALSPAHAIAIMATTTGPQGINSTLRRLLTQSRDEALRLREAYLNTLRSAFDELNADEHGELLAKLVGSGDGLSFDARRDHSRKLVEQSLADLTSYRETIIVTAEIDSARVASVASAAASEITTRNLFPRHLFDEITVTTDDLSEFTMSVNGLDRGSFTDPPMEDPVLNEEEWWRDVMSNRVAAVVWSDVIRKTNFQDIDGRTPDDFWRAVRDGSAKIREAGHDPLLVINDAFNPEWWSDWRWPEGRGDTPKPSDLVITIEEGQVDSYELTMNDTPVYSAQTENGVAYLIPSQLLRRLRFRDYGDGLPVSLRFETDANNPRSGTMHAAFQREVELADVESYRVRWTQAHDNPVSSED